MSSKANDCMKAYVLGEISTDEWSIICLLSDPCNLTNEGNFTKNSVDKVVAM